MTTVNACQAGLFAVALASLHVAVSSIAANSPPSSAGDASGGKSQDTFDTVTGSGVVGDTELLLSMQCSAAQIEQGDHFSVQVSIRNTGAAPIRVLPINRNLWSAYTLVFEEPPAGDRGRRRMELGSEPRIGGLNAVVPITLGPGESMTAQVDLLTSSVVYTDDAFGRLLFTIPGEYAFCLCYRVDDAAARAFGLDQCEIRTGSTSVGVNAAPNRSPEGARPKQAAFDRYLDLDGRYVPRRRVRGRISEGERSRIRTSFREVVALEDESGRHGQQIRSVRLQHYIASDGTVYFGPFTSRNRHKQIAASPELMQLLRTRMLSLQRAMRDRGLKAIATGDWDYWYERCGN